MLILRRRVRSVTDGQMYQLLFKMMIAFSQHLVLALQFPDLNIIDHAIDHDLKTMGTQLDVQAPPVDRSMCRLLMLEVETGVPFLPLLMHPPRSPSTDTFVFA